MAFPQNTFFAHSRMHVLLSLLFSAFITHGYLPYVYEKITNFLCFSVFGIFFDHVLKFENISDFGGTSIHV